MNNEIVKLQEEIKRDTRQIRMIATAGRILCAISMAIVMIEILK